MRRFKPGKIGEVDPVPSSDEDILGFNVPMMNPSSVAVAKAAKKLECNPALLYFF